jgi:hypothetical protein
LTDAKAAWHEQGCCLRRSNESVSVPPSMKKVIIAAFYTLGLSAFIPFLIVNHRSSAAWPMFLAPIVAAVFAEVLSRTIRFTEQKPANRVIWLVAAFILLVQVAKFGLGLDATAGFTEYLALNALYQIVLLLLFSAPDNVRNKGADIGHGHVF